MHSALSNLTEYISSFYQLIDRASEHLAELKHEIQRRQRVPHLVMSYPRIGISGDAGHRFSCDVVVFPYGH